MLKKSRYKYDDGKSIALGDKVIASGSAITNSSGEKCFIGFEEGRWLVESPLAKMAYFLSDVINNGKLIKAKEDNINGAWFSDIAAYQCSNQSCQKLHYIPLEAIECCPQPLLKKRTLNDCKTILATACYKCNYCGSLTLEKSNHTCKLTGSLTNE